nr:phosphatidate cytidylyltransferase [Rubricella aquisinus]
MRAASGVGLGLLALLLFWLGGWWSAALLAVGAGLMVWEFREMVLGEGAGTSVLGLLSIAAAAGSVIATEALEMRFGIILVAIVAVILTLGEGRRGRMAVFGFLYISVAMMCIDGLRADEKYGFVAVIWLIIIVIGADVGGYFAGRMFGGPKLWLRVSPKKTWSGFFGGILLAVLLGLIFSALTPGTFAVKVALMSALIAVVSVGGDLIESACKRYYGIKDSSNLLPGHGGVLDRLDGLMAAAIVAGLITFARGQSVFVW